MPKKQTMKRNKKVNESEVKGNNPTAITKVEGANSAKMILQKTKDQTIDVAKHNSPGVKNDKEDSLLSIEMETLTVKAKENFTANAPAKDETHALDDQEITFILNDKKVHATFVDKDDKPHDIDQSISSDLELEPAEADFAFNVPDDVEERTLGPSKRIYRIQSIAERKKALFGSKDV